MSPLRRGRRDPSQTATNIHPERVGAANGTRHVRWASHPDRTAARPIRFSASAGIGTNTLWLTQLNDGRDACSIIL
jgi:hypothetical protein